jgi:nicotinate phosphoribosyltransferase
MIIQSLLDTDLYKFSMMQVVLHHFPGAMVEYRFKCRTPDVDLAPHAAEIRRQIRHLCSLRFQRDELDYLRTLRFLKGDFVDLLRLFQLDEDSIEMRETPSANGGLDIAIRGPWLHTILFEVPVLAIVSEATSVRTAERFAQGMTRLEQKISMVTAVPTPSRSRFRYPPALLQRLAAGHTYPKSARPSLR